MAQAERRLRDAALELGPYGAERQQRAVEIAVRDVQDQLNAGDLADLDLSVSQLQEALYGLNRRLAKERTQDSNPLQGLKNTLGSLKDELFADDDWDDWDRGRSRDPWAEPSWSSSGRSGLGFNGAAGMGGFDSGRGAESRYEGNRYENNRYDDSRYDDSRSNEPRYNGSRYDQSRYDEPRDDNGSVDTYRDTYRDNGFDNRRGPRAAAAAGTPRQDPFEGDPWGED